MNQQSSILSILKSPCDPYEVQTPLGRGKYSEVFDGVDTVNNRKVVIKFLKPVRQPKIIREIKILQSVKDGPYIIKLYDVCYDQMSNTPALIFEYFSSHTLKHITKNITIHKIQFVMKQLLEALAYCHSKGIMHRDVKPSNIVVDPQTLEIRLLDWGLSEFYLEDNEYHTRVSSRPFKGPELLIGYKKYDFSMDIWSVGCILAGLIFDKNYFFLGKDNDDQLTEIVKILGTPKFQDYLKKYNVLLHPNIMSLNKGKQEIPFEKFITKENQHLVSKEGIDLIKKMLIYDHAERITAQEALLHPFFDSLK